MRICDVCGKEASVLLKLNEEHIRPRVKELCQNCMGAIERISSAIVKKHMLLAKAEINHEWEDMIKKTRVEQAGTIKKNKSSRRS